MYKISEEIQAWPVSELKENPIAIELYYSGERKRGEESREIKSMAESLKSVGQLESLLIKPDGTIIDGHWRYRAAKKAKIKELNVRIIDLPDDENEEAAIIMAAHIRRDKTASIIYREAKTLERIYLHEAEHEENAKQC